MEEEAIVEEMKEPNRYMVGGVRMIHATSVKEGFEEKEEEYLKQVMLSAGGFGLYFEEDGESTCYREFRIIFSV